MGLFDHLPPYPEDLCTGSPTYPWPCTAKQIPGFKIIHVGAFGSVDGEKFERNLARFCAILKAGKRGKFRPGYLYPMSTSRNQTVEKE